jgi:exosortase/archaeosortase family protein
MVALIAGQLFLRKTWTRTVLAVSMIALGIARNALRIFILAQLCLHVSPDILDSDLHRRGGPVFFALSMIPFVVLLWYLRKSEFRTTQPPQPS